MSKKYGDRYIEVKKLNDSFVLIEDTEDDYRYKLMCKFPEEKDKDLIRIYCDLKHPSIVKCEKFEENKEFYLIKECFTTRNLEERIKSIQDNKQLYEKQVVYWLFRILQAVDHLHIRTILHKQICKEYIGFEFDEIKLDINPYGSILGTSRAQAGIELENIGSNIKSPEKSLYNLKFDIWCCGMLLYYLCTLQDPNALLKNVKNFENWVPPTLPSFFPTELKQIYLEMLAVDPNKRPSTENLLRNDIFNDYKNIYQKTLLNGRYSKTNKSYYSDYSQTFFVLDTKDEKKKKYLQRFFRCDDKSRKLADQYLKLFNHAHLQSVQDIFEEDTFFYTVTPCYDTTLRENLKSHPPEIQLTWFIQLLTAVDALHSNKILHKYIHPGFIVFSNDSIKLKHYEKSSIINSPDEKVKVFPSDLCYMCPELTDQNMITLKYDILCLGLTFYEMCTKEDVYFRSVEKNYATLELPQFVPELIKQQFKKMIDKNPMNRPTTEELITNLSGLSSGFLNIIKSAKESLSIDEIEPLIEEQGIKNEKVLFARYVKEPLKNTDSSILGVGNFGLVYLVEDEFESKKRKALKEIWLNEEINLSEKITRELEQMKLLNYSTNNHINVVGINEFFIVNEFKNIYFEVDYFKDGDLDQILTSNKLNKQKVDEKLYIDWLMQLTAGVDFLHSKDVIHRNIKPKNIYFENKTLKLGDMALSDLVEYNMKKKSFKTYGACYLYTSPELLNMTNESSYSSKADIWSIGCIMHELLQNEKTFKTIEDILAHKLPTILRQNNPKLIFLERQLIEKEPSKRPTANELYKKLHELQVEINSSKK